MKTINRTIPILLALTLTVIGYSNQARASGPGYDCTMCEAMKLGMLIYVGVGSVAPGNPIGGTLMLTTVAGGAISEFSKDRNREVSNDPALREAVAFVVESQTLGEQTKPSSPILLEAIANQRNKLLDEGVDAYQMSDMEIAQSLITTSMAAK